VVDQLNFVFGNAVGGTAITGANSLGDLLLAHVTQPLRVTILAEPLATRIRALHCEWSAIEAA
jgi:hypothetical protein